MVDQFILGAEENILIKGYIEISYVELETNWAEHALRKEIWWFTGLEYDPFSFKLLDWI